MKSIAITIVMAILQAMIAAASPLLRNEITKFVKSLKEKANGTPSPFDDALVKMLGDLLGVD